MQIDLMKDGKITIQLSDKEFEGLDSLVDFYQAGRSVQDEITETDKFVDDLQDHIQMIQGA